MSGKEKGKNQGGYQSLLRRVEGLFYGFFDLVGYLDSGRAGCPNRLKRPFRGVLFYCIIELRGVWMDFYG